MAATSLSYRSQLDDGRLVIGSAADKKLSTKSLWASQRVKDIRKPIAVLRLMLPDAANFPSSPLEPSEVPLIACPIGAKLISPKVRQLVLPRGQTPAMPEVAIDKNRDAMPAENDIRTSRE
jgi:hypothetical protein